MDRWKAEMERVREKRKIRREKGRRERVRRKKMQMREKVGKSRNTVFFQWFVGPEGRLAKAAGAELAGQMRDEKLHAVVVRSTFPSQNVQSTPRSDHFWKLRCWKSARCCGAKQISKSKCTKHTSFGPLLLVEMSKKCTPLWREAHFQVKMYKTLGVRTTFGSCDVEKVHAVVARSTFPSQNVQNTPCMDHFWRRFRCRFASQAQGIVDLVKSEQKREGFVAFQLQPPLHYTTLQYITLHYNYNYNYTFTTFYYATLHYTTLQSITFNYTTLHYITLHYTTLHDTTLHYTTLHYTTLHYTALHYTTVPSTTLHYSTLHSTTLQLHLQLHSTTLNYTTVRYTTLQYITLHYTTLHYTTLHWMTLHHR